MILQCKFHKINTHTVIMSLFKNTAPQRDGKYGYRRGEDDDNNVDDYIRENKLYAEDWEWWSGMLPPLINGIPTWLFAIQNGNVSVYYVDLMKRCKIAEATDYDQCLKVARAIQLGYGPFNIRDIPFRKGFDSEKHFKFARDI